MDKSDLSAEEATPSEWRGQFCSEEKSVAEIIEGRERWEAIWKGSIGREAPRVDFTKYFALAVFLGSRNTGGYAVEFMAPLTDAKTAQLRYKVRGPGGNAFVIQAFTQPYAVKLYRKTALELQAAEIK